MAVFCALWILSFMGLSSINKSAGEVSIFESAKLKTLFIQNTQGSFYAEDPLEKYMLSLVEVSEESDFILDEKIESILASNVPPIRLAELVK